MCLHLPHQVPILEKQKKPTRLGPFVIIPLIGGGQGNSNILGGDKISLNASS